MNMIYHISMIYKIAAIRFLLNPPGTFPSFALLGCWQVLSNMFGIPVPLWSHVGGGEGEKLEEK